MYVPRVAAKLISVNEATEVALVLSRKNGDCEAEVDGKRVPVAPKVREVYVVNWAKSVQFSKGVEKGPVSETTREGATHAGKACFT